MKAVFIRNVPAAVTDGDILDLLEAAGLQPLHPDVVARDRETGASRGYGVVEVRDEDQERAIQLLNGARVKGVRLVAEAFRGRYNPLSKRPYFRLKSREG